MNTRSQNPQEFLETASSTPKSSVNLTRDGFDDLLNSSKFVVTGTAKQTLWVIDSNKVKKSDPVRQPNSNQYIVPIQPPSEYVIGVLVRLEIDEVLSLNSKLLSEDSLFIFIPDGYNIPIGTSTPYFLDKKRYLVFLEPMEVIDRLKGASVYDPMNPTKKSMPLDHKSTFLVNRKELGYLKLTESNKHIVDEVRNFMKSSK